MLEYKLENKYLSKIISPQLEKFKEFFQSHGLNYIPIQYTPQCYYVNKDVDEYLTNTKFHAISFFSGAGGLDIGVQLAGVKVISSLDFDEDSVRSMQSNKYFSHTKHILGDIQKVSGKDYSSILKKNNPEKLILVGGPPCQPFSKAGYWVTHENRLGSSDPRNMIGQYLRMIDELRPDGFILENVESILHPKNQEAVSELEEAIDRMGYKVNRYRANSADFGVPQRRKRVFFVASKNIHPLDPIITHGTNEEIIKNPNLKPHERVIDWIGQYDIDEYFEKEEITIGKTYSDELMSVPPGMNYIALTERENYPNPKFEANKRFWSFLLKLHPLQTSWTIAAQPGPWVGPFHWNGRRLRIKEIAAIQTFPSDYIFKGTRRSIQKQIGNAVPSLLGKAVVESLKTVL